MATALIDSHTYRVTRGERDAMLTELLTQINETMAAKGHPLLPLKWVEFDLDRIWFEDESITVRTWDIRGARKYVLFRVSVFKQ